MKIFGQFHNVCGPGFEIQSNTLLLPRYLVTLLDSLVTLLDDLVALLDNLVTLLDKLITLLDNQVHC